MYQLTSTIRLRNCIFVFVKFKKLHVIDKDRVSQTLRVINRLTFVFDIFRLRIKLVIDNYIRTIDQVSLSFRVITCAVIDISDIFNCSLIDKSEITRNVTKNIE